MSEEPTTYPQAVQQVLPHLYEIAELLDDLEADGELPEEFKLHRARLAHLIETGEALVGVSVPKRERFMGPS